MNVTEKKNEQNTYTIANSQGLPISRCREKNTRLTGT